MDSNVKDRLDGFTKNIPLHKIHDKILTEKDTQRMTDSK
jgi:hypothetical protein